MAYTRTHARGKAHVPFIVQLYSKTSRVLAPDVWRLAMSSKKSALSHEASLGACLSFAAQVLVSESPASQVCTKDALSPMVVHAHRFGQQVGKLRGSTDKACNSTDPRKLLKKLQARPREPEEGTRAVEIDRLAFKDLTWDSHGDVDQTLEMELLELESRAAEADASICVLLTLCAPVTRSLDPSVSPEAAILWFPASDRQSSSGKKQYLLYVCPGRIKVVKSIPELLKKLRDESNLMDARDALYNVWTLSRASSRHDAKKPPSNQLEEKDSGAEKRETASSLHASAIQHHREPIRVRPVGEAPRCLPSSIFSFATAPIATNERTAATTQVVPTPHTQNERIGTTFAHEEVPFPVPAPVNEPGSPRPTQPARRQVISASYSGGPPRSRTPPGVHDNLLWTSFDSDLKKPLLPKRSSGAEPQDSGDAPSDHTRDDEQPSDLLSAVDLSSQTKRQSASHQILEPTQHEPSLRATEGDETSIFMFAQHPPTYTNDSSIRTSRDRGSASEHPNEDGNCDSEEQQGISNDEQDADNNSADISEEASSAVEVQRLETSQQNEPRRAPARKNYRAKLGNRVWWELRCAAERLQHQTQTAEAETSSPSLKTPLQMREQKQTPATEPDTAELSPRNSQPHVCTNSLGDKFDSLSGSRRVVPVEADATSSTMRFVDAKPASSSHELSPWTEQAVNRTDDGVFQRRRTRSSNDETIFEPIKAVPIRYEHEGRSSLSHVVALSLPLDNGRANSRSVARPSDTNTGPSSSEVALQASPSAGRAVVTVSLTDAYEIEYTEVQEPSDLPTHASATSLRRSSGGQTKQHSSAQSRRTADPAANGHNDDDDDDDEKLAQNQWATTRSSYEEHSEKPRSQCDRQPGDAPRSSIPVEELLPVTTASRMNGFGSVPIRSRRRSPLMARRPEIEDENSSSEEDEAASPPLALSPPKRERSPLQRDARQETVDSQQRTRVDVAPFAVAKHTQHVATFIAVDMDVARKPGVAAASTNHPSREERLAELRRKKLQQLHKAREEQQQQQLKKKVQLQRIKSTLVGQASSETDSSAPATATATAAHAKAAKKPSNKKLVQNALEFTLLAGGSMEKDRNAALAALALSSCDNFIVLLKSTKDLKFRALYEHHADREEVSRLFAATPKCPQQLTCDAIGQFFKYNSGKKEFVAIDSRSFTVKTDACALKDELVFRKKTGIGRLL